MLIGGGIGGAIGPMGWNIGGPKPDWADEENTALGTYIFSQFYIYQHQGIKGISVFLYNTGLHTFRPHTQKIQYIEQINVLIEYD